MMYETPQDTYNAYTKFLKKKEYRKAYRCLEKMLHEFPYDTDLLMDIMIFPRFNGHQVRLP